MISGYLVGDRQLIAKMNRMPAAVQTEVARVVDQLGLRLIANVVQNKLSGQVLKRRTGKLAASIARGSPETRSKFVQTATSATSIVGTNVSYGKTWELGAHVPAYTIYPKNAKALHFTYHGQEVFAKKVNIPAHEIKPRPFLAPALQEMKPLIIAELQAVLTNTCITWLKQ
jgi:phage gpG-like protein